VKIAGRIAAALVAIAALAPAAAAEPHALCDGGDFEPASVAIRDTGIDAARSACTRAAIRFRARGLAEVATDDFFGTVSSSLFAEARWLILAGVELEVGARLVDYRFAQNAVLSDDEIGAGPIIAGIGQARPLRRFGKAAMWAPRLRVEVPRTNSALDATPFSASPSATLTLIWSDATRTHSRAGLLLWLARGPTGLDSRAAAAVSTDVAWRRSWLTLTAGGELQAGWHRDFDHFLARGAVRIGGDIGVDLAAGAPLFGAERTNGVVTLGVSANR
jgi:hypothetical protein